MGRGSRPACSIGPPHRSALHRVGGRIWAPPYNPSHTLPSNQGGGEGLRFSLHMMSSRIGIELCNTTASPVQGPFQEQRLGYLA